VFRDVIEIAEQISRDSTASALRFFDNVEATLDGLLQMPGKGSPKEFAHPALAGLRSWPVEGFPNHLVFYRQTDYGMFVLAIMHGARDLPAILEGRG
jgi:toxin ParE1/3/4